MDVNNLLNTVNLVTKEIVKIVLKARLKNLQQDNKEIDINISSELKEDFAAKILNDNIKLKYMLTDKESVTRKQFYEILTIEKDMLKLCNKYEEALNQSKDLMNQLLSKINDPEENENKNDIVKSKMRDTMLVTKIMELKKKLHLEQQKHEISHLLKQKSEDKLDIYIEYLTSLKHNIESDKSKCLSLICNYLDKLYLTKITDCFKEIIGDFDNEDHLYELCYAIIEKCNMTMDRQEFAKVSDEVVNVLRNVRSCDLQSLDILKYQRETFGYHQMMIEYQIELMRDKQNMDIVRNDYSKLTNDYENLILEFDTLRQVIAKLNVSHFKQNRGKQDTSNIMKITELNKALILSKAENKKLTEKIKKLEEDMLQLDEDFHSAKAVLKGYEEFNETLSKEMNDMLDTQDELLAANAQVESLLNTISNMQAQEKIYIERISELNDIIENMNENAEEHAEEQVDPPAQF